MSRTSEGEALPALWWEIPVPSNMEKERRRLHGPAKAARAGCRKEGQAKQGRMAAGMTGQTITMGQLQSLIDELAPLFPERTEMSLFGFPVFVAPEYPKVKLNYKCRTKYGDEFDFLTREERAATEAWLLAAFGTTSAIPEGTAYMFNTMFGNGLHVSPRDVVKLTGFV
jgi:hypothetical protein